MIPKKVLILENSAPTHYKKWINENLSDRSVEITALNVEKALKSLGYTVERFKVLQNPLDLIYKLQNFKPDLVFQLCESLNGISKLEPTIPYLLNWLKIPFTGNLPNTIALLLDKAKTKHILKSLNLPTPNFTEIYNNNIKHELENWYEYPAIVKPNSEDASLGIDNESIVFDAFQASERINKLLHLFDPPVLLEKYIEGKEINISLLEISNHEIKISYTEIDFSNLPSNIPKILTYKAKWHTESEEYILTPSIAANNSLDKSIKEILRTIAIQIWHYFELKGYARIDIRLDKNNNPYVLEINPNPDLAPDAGFSKSIRQLGFTYEDIISSIVNSAIISN